MRSESKNNDTESDNAFDPARLQLSQDFGEEAGVRKLLTTVPVRPPHRQSFVRVHFGPSWRLDTAILTLKDEQERYLVDPTLWVELAGEIVPTALFTTVTRQGLVFLWPVRLPGADGRHDPWSRSALDAAERAMEFWLRIAANMALGAYEVFRATADIPDPKWPEEEGFPGLLKIAFKDRFIATLDHPVIQRLRGVR
jgi:hypothetical protein